MNKVELFRIITDETVWTLTSSDTDQIYNSGTGDELYQKTAIQRTDVEQKKELTKASVTVKIPIDHPFSTFLLSSFFEQLISLTIFERIDSTTSVFWKGRLASIQPANAELSLVFESIFTSLRRPGLRATFQRNCRFALYGKGCNLNPATFAMPGTMTAISANVLTVTEADAQVDGYFTGGMVGAPDGSLSYIVSHVGSQIVIQRISAALLQAFALTGPATTITMYPGCDHSRLTCHTKFSNVLNYGGFDWIPNKNPMSESIV